MSFTDNLIKKYAAEAERIYEARTAGDFTWTGLLADLFNEMKEQQQYHVVTGDGWVFLYVEKYNAWAALGEVEWYDDVHAHQDDVMWDPHTARCSIYKGFEEGIAMLAESNGIVS